MPSLILLLVVLLMLWALLMVSRRHCLSSCEPMLADVLCNIARGCTNARKALTNFLADHDTPHRCMVRTPIGMVMRTAGEVSLPAPASPRLGPSHPRMRSRGDNRRNVSGAPMDPSCLFQGPSRSTVSCGAGTDLLSEVSSIPMSTVACT
jgi:hypothetical protein